MALFTFREFGHLVGVGGYGQECLLFEFEKAVVVTTPKVYALIESIRSKGQNCKLSLSDQSKFGFRFHGKPTLEIQTITLIDGTVVWDWLEEPDFDRLFKTGEKDAIRKQRIEKSGGLG